MDLRRRHASSGHALGVTSPCGKGRGHQKFTFSAHGETTVTWWYHAPSAAEH